MKGAEIVFLPAEWPHPRLNHWRRLIQARAIENQVFLVSCNRVGKTERYHFFGHSMVVDPWGKVLFEGNESETNAIVEIDLQKIVEARKKLDTLGDVSKNVVQGLSGLISE